MEKKFIDAYIKADSIDEKNYTIDFIMTIETEDRHGDIVDVDSIKTENFMLNPVVLPSHDHRAKAVGKVIEITKEIIDGKKAMIGRVQFAVKEYDLAETYWNLYKGGFMSAVSIGFIPEKGEVVNDTFILYGADIIELSLVSVPANQLALAKSKGIDIEPVLNGENGTQVMKEVKDILISFKTLFESEQKEEEKEEETEEGSEEKKPTNPMETATASLDKGKVKSKNARLVPLLNKAIRQLNK